MTHSSRQFVKKYKRNRSMARRWVGMVNWGDARLSFGCVEFLVLVGLASAEGWYAVREMLLDS